MRGYLSVVQGDSPREKFQNKNSEIYRWSLDKRFSIVYICFQWLMFKKQLLDTPYDKNHFLIFQKLIVSSLWCLKLTA